MQDWIYKKINQKVFSMLHKNSTLVDLVIYLQNAYCNCPCVAYHFQFAWFASLTCVDFLSHFINREARYSASGILHSAKRRRLNARQRHLGFYAAALHRVMRACIEDVPANAIVPFLWYRVAFQMYTRTVILESGRDFFFVRRMTVVSE